MMVKLNYYSTIALYLNTYVYIRKVKGLKIIRVVISYLLPTINSVIKYSH